MRSGEMRGWYGISSRKMGPGKKNTRERKSVEDEAGTLLR